MKTTRNEGMSITRTKGNGRSQTVGNNGRVDNKGRGTVHVIVATWRCLIKGLNGHRGASYALAAT